jgi:TatD DNase family protein
LPPVLIDTHCHLNDPAFLESLPDVIARAQAVGVNVFIVPAFDRQSLARTAELAALFPNCVFPAFGIHPWYVQEPIDYNEVINYLRRKDTVAVGEIGLDFSPEALPPQIQVDAFIRQLGLARDLDLPVAIHCRKAYEALYQTLAGYGNKVHGVIHSFSGSTKLMSMFLKLGFYISFSGAVTRSTAKKYHRNAAALPMDRLLLETDAPSIATETTVASLVEPAHTVEVAQKIAEIRGIPYEEVCTRSAENARKLFRLP